jgi:hypothetical protein
MINNTKFIHILQFQYININIVLIKNKILEYLLHITKIYIFWIIFNKLWMNF